MPYPLLPTNAVAAGTFVRKERQVVRTSRARMDIGDNGASARGG